MGLVKFERNCPSCNGLIRYKYVQHYNKAKLLNCLCKRCSSKKNAEKHNKLENEKWEPIFVNIPRRRKTFYRWKRIWESFDEEKKRYVLKKTDIQKIYFWGHINRAQRVLWKKNLKQSFIKHLGNNHWIHRPEVYSKIIETCKKYRGDNHWFRNPNYVKKQRL